MAYSNIEFKSNPGQFNIDEAQGIVECFVAGIGNKDSVGDVLVPGAFTESLKRRKPRVVWGHNWNDPIGKVLEIYEVGPGDPRLPQKMKTAGIGGLYARVQFNLNSEKGREAFANVAFFGHEQEWSIGYKTLDAIHDPAIHANVLKEVELYEVSPVLHGANQLTGTISVKSDDLSFIESEKGWGMMPGHHMHPKPMHQPSVIVIREDDDDDKYESEKPIFAEGLAQPIGGEQRQRLEREIMERTGSQVRLLQATENTALFSRMMPNGASATFRIGYHTPDNYRTFMFGKPELANGEMRPSQISKPSGSRVVVPSQMPSMPMQIKPNYQQNVPMDMFKSEDGEKSDLASQVQALEDLIMEEAEEKVGKTINKRNLSKLKSILENLQEVIASAEKEEMATKGYVIPVELENAFHTKQLLDPIFDYHRVEAEVTERGIVVTSGVTDEFIEAIGVAEKALGRAIGGGAGKVRRGARGLTARFDPNAWDGDGDGLVQEGTPFQRPAIPGVNDRSTRGRVDAAAATRAFQQQSPSKPSKERGMSSRGSRATVAELTKNPPSKPSKPVSKEFIEQLDDITGLIYDALGDIDSTDGDYEIDEDGSLIEILAKTWQDMYWGNTEKPTLEESIKDLEEDYPELVGKKFSVGAFTREEAWGYERDTGNYSYSHSGTEVVIRSLDPDHNNSVFSILSNEEGDFLGREAGTMIDQDSVGKLEKLKKETREKFFSGNESRGMRSSGSSAKENITKDNVVREKFNSDTFIESINKINNLQDLGRWLSSGMALDYSDSRVETDEYEAWATASIGAEGTIKEIFEQIEEQINSGLYDTPWSYASQSVYDDDFAKAIDELEKRLGKGKEYDFTLTGYAPARYDRGYGDYADGWDVSDDDSQSYSIREIEPKERGMRSSSPAKRTDSSAKENITKDNVVREKFNSDTFIESINKINNLQDLGRWLSSGMALDYSDSRVETDEYEAWATASIGAEGTIKEIFEQIEEQINSGLYDTPWSYASQSVYDDDFAKAIDELEKRLGKGKEYDFTLTGYAPARYDRGYGDYADGWDVSDDDSQSYSIREIEPKERGMRSSSPAKRTEAEIVGLEGARESAKKEVEKGLESGVKAGKITNEQASFISNLMENTDFSGFNDSPGKVLSGIRRSIVDAVNDGDLQIKDSTDFTDELYRAIQKSLNAYDAAGVIKPRKEDRGRGPFRDANERIANEWSAKFDRELRDVIDNAPKSKKQIEDAKALSGRERKRLISDLEDGDIEAGDAFESALDDIISNDPSINKQELIDEVLEAIEKGLENDPENENLRSISNEYGGDRGRDFLLQFAEASAYESEFNTSRLDIDREVERGMASRSGGGPGTPVTEVEKKKVLRDRAAIDLYKDTDSYREALSTWKQGNPGKSDKDFEKSNEFVDGLVAFDRNLYAQAEAATGIPQNRMMAYSGRPMSSEDATARSILRQRMTGASIREVAEKIGISPEKARSLEAKEVARLREEASEREVLAYRLGGLSLRDTANLFGMNPKDVRRVEAREMAKIRENMTDDDLLELRMMGFSLEDIAEITGIPRTELRKREIKRINRGPKGKGPDSPESTERGMASQNIRPNSGVTKYSSELLEGKLDDLDSDPQPGMAGATLDKEWAEGVLAGLRDGKLSSDDAINIIGLAGQDVFNEGRKPEGDRDQSLIDSRIKLSKRLRRAVVDDMSPEDMENYQAGRRRQMGADRGMRSTLAEANRRRDEGLTPGTGEDRQRGGAGRTESQAGYTPDTSERDEKIIQKLRDIGLGDDEIRQLTGIENLPSVDRGMRSSGSGSSDGMQNPSSGNKKKMKVEGGKPEIEEMIKDLQAISKLSNSELTEVPKLIEALRKAKDNDGNLEASNQELAGYIRELNRLEDDGFEDFENANKLRSMVNEMFSSRDESSLSEEERDRLESIQDNEFEAFMEDSRGMASRTVRKANAPRKFRSESGVINPHSKIEMTLDGDSLGLIVEDLDMLIRNNPQSSALKAARDKFSSAKSGDKVSMTNAEYEAIYRDAEKAKNNGRIPSSELISLLDQTVESKDGKYVHPELGTGRGMASKTPKGRRPNNGAPTDITEAMQKEYIFWARNNPNLYVAQRILAKYDKNDGELSPSDWRALDTLYTNLSPRGGGRRSGMRSSGTPSWDAVSNERVGRDRAADRPGMTAAGLGDIGVREEGLGRQEPPGPTDAKFSGSSFNDVKPDNWDELDLEEQFEWMFTDGRVENSGMSPAAYEGALKALIQEEERIEKSRSRRNRGQADVAEDQDRGMSSFTVGRGREGSSDGTSRRRGRFGRGDSGGDRSDKGRTGERTSGPIKTDGWKKTGGQMGSQPGGKFQDPATGKEYYIKEPKSKLHAENESLVTRLYERLGIGTSRVEVGEHNGKPKIVSEWLPGSKTVLHVQKMKDKKWKQEVQKSFVASAWLANWDATANSGNIVEGADGLPYIIDSGGGLLFRARGEAKGTRFGPVVGEMDTLRDRRMNALGYDYFNDIPETEIARQVAEIRKISDDEIRKMVSGSISDPAKAKELSDILIARRDYLVKNWGTGRKDGSGRGMSSSSGDRLSRSAKNSGLSQSVVRSVSTAEKSYNNYISSKPQNRGMSSRAKPPKSGRTMITDEATYFGQIDRSLPTEIKKATEAKDSKVAEGLRLLQSLISRQEAAKTGDRRTNVGSLFMTADEADQILDAVMWVLDRQIQRDGNPERIAAFAKLVDKVAEAAMSTFIDKDTAEIGSRTQKRTSRTGRTVEIPKTNL